MEGKAGKGVRGVSPDAGELPHLVDCPRELSAMSIHDRFCCGVEISRASVIAEALPCPKHLIFRSARKGWEIRKCVQPLVVIRYDGSDLRLLEHELGDEDCVRIARAAPREMTSMAAIPLEKRAAKSANVW